MKVNREELARTVDVADWGMLRAHLERGGLIVVDQTLELLDVAMKVAGDDAALIQSWITDGRIGKPTSEQIRAWDSDGSYRFTMVIVSPYVLIQQQNHNITNT